MDYMGQLGSGYLQVNDLNRTVVDCRVMARKLDLIITWRIKNRTATAFLRYNGHKVWNYTFTHDYPHMVLCLMYGGIYTELCRRDKENQDAILRMRQVEEQRNQERKVMNMPNWQERHNQSK